MAAAMQTQKILTVRDLGLVDYGTAYALQKEYVQKVLGGEGPTVFLCEHPPVITLGRMSKHWHVFHSPEELEQKGVALFPIDRGGDVTLHAPGQLVLYPILNLAAWKKDLHWYLRQLEQVGIDLLESFGIVASSISGKTGVWTGMEKVVSIGVGVKKWVTYHGLAININTDLDYFKLIKPCGLDVQMTSLKQLLGGAVDMREARERLLMCFAHVFDAALERV